MKMFPSNLFVINVPFFLSWGHFSKIILANLILVFINTLANWRTKRHFDAYVYVNYRIKKELTAE
jgi:hypothetical protein